MSDGRVFSDMVIIGDWSFATLAERRTFGVPVG